MTVNGWQQGWVLPRAPQPITLSFTSNGLYRAGLIGGLALLPLLALLAFIPVRRPRRTDEAAPMPVAATTGDDERRGSGGRRGNITNPGVIVGGAALGLRYLLRNRERLCDAATVQSPPAV